MRYIAILGALFALAACGIDGAPERPEGGVTIGGEARIGVVGSL